MNRIPTWASLLFFLVIAFTSCKKDELLTDSSAKLEFSDNTILFDTVFVTVGSATQVFTVRNTNDKPVRISSVRVATGNSSYFRLNVNGIPGNTFTDVEIDANDSIYVFAEVTIPDPNSPNTPFIITDSIRFELNGNQQFVKLVAWGQRAHFHYAPPNRPSLFYLPHNDTWTNDLPHVIYGYALVDSGALTLEQGTNVHFHPGSGMIVFTTGKIIANGTLASPVTFQGDRLGEDYKDIPGQWDRIQLSQIAWIDINTNPITVYRGFGPGGSLFNYTIIKNGYIGLHSDTVAVKHAPAAILNNCILKNFASTALLGQGTNIQANNCVFANCGEYCAALLYGGDYRFLHCTFANYWANGNRQTPLLLMQNYYDNVRPLDSAYFGNCILYGNLEQEIGLDSTTSGTPADFNFVFENSIIKVESSFSTSAAGHYRSILRNANPLFDDTDHNNYKLNTTSPAVDAGLVTIPALSPVLGLDLKGDVRPQGSGPDLGAYEKR